MEGRVTRKEFSEITGISKSTFYDRYRWSGPKQRRFDMRLEQETGRLTMDEEAVKEFARQRKGRRADKRSPQADRLGDHAEKDELSDESEE